MGMVGMASRCHTHFPIGKIPSVRVPRRAARKASSMRLPPDARCEEQAWDSTLLEVGGWTYRPAPSPSLKHSEEWRFVTRMALRGLAVVGGRRAGHARVDKQTVWVSIVGTFGIWYAVQASCCRCWIC